MKVLGVSAFYHDSAAALVERGRIVAAAQEERFTRLRHDPSYPERAIEYCLETAGIEPTDLDAIVFYEQPYVKFFDRIVKNHIAEWPFSGRAFIEAFSVWMGEKLWAPYHLFRTGRFRVPVRFVGHHESHAASAFLPSGFDEAAIITVDGVGEWASTTIGYGEGNDFALTQELRYPHSLGLLYSAMTAYLGFRVNSAEYKVMGLAPYGEPTMVDKFHRLADLRDDGSLRIRLEHFRYHRSLRMPSRALEELFGQPTRREEEPLTQFHKDCARSLQEFLNEAMLRIARRAHASYPSKNLVLAGGVALNCVSNSFLKQHGPFENVFVQPAAGDAGGALGAALMGSRELDPNFQRPVMDRADLGPEFTEQQCCEALEKAGLPYRRVSRQELPAVVARRIADQAIVGWFQGRMEFGPRALGQRSILADPRDPANRDRVNLAIKFRESFRPFAPCVPEECVADWFDWQGPAPFMLFTAPTKDPAKLPAVAHVDGSARLQTIAAHANPLYHELHRCFGAITGIPVLINTSFNVRGEPIVCTPAEAIACFLGTHLDLLVLENFVVEKADVPPERLQLEEHRHAFSPD